MPTTATTMSALCVRQQMSPKHRLAWYVFRYTIGIIETGELVWMKCESVGGPHETHYGACLCEGVHAKSNLLVAACWVGSVGAKMNRHEIKMFARHYTNNENAAILVAGYIQCRSVQ